MNIMAKMRIGRKEQASRAQVLHWNRFCMCFSLKIWQRTCFTAFFPTRLAIFNAVLRLIPKCMPT